MPYRDAMRAARAGSASLATKVEKVWSVLQSATDLPPSAGPPPVSACTMQESEEGSSEGVLARVEKMFQRQTEAMEARLLKPKDAARYVRRANDQITCDDAAAETDNRTLQTKVERQTRSDKLDGNPIFDTIFEANTDQVMGKRRTWRMYVGC